MNARQLLALLPLIVLAAAAVAVMLAAAFRRRHDRVARYTQGGFLLALAALVPAGLAAPTQVTPLLIVDGYALFVIALVAGAGLAVAVLAYDYLKPRPGAHEELYLLLLLAVLGAAVLAGSRHFAAFFLGLELLSVALFALVAYPAGAGPAGRSLEAGIKYLILSGVASPLLLFGMALIYAQTGSLEFAALSGPLAAADVYLLAGLALVVAGVGFKLSVAPFHLWTPDVYQGAAAPVTAFLATVSKGAVFAVALRWFIAVDGYAAPTLLWTVSLIAMASMLAGNLLALLQDNVKRILAYSSIAHMGYLLVALLAGGGWAVEAALVYLLAYFITTLGAFGIVGVVSESYPEAQAGNLSDWRGLFWRRPGLAAMFTAMLLSLAGIPLTAGFVGKFYVAAAGVHGALWLALMVLVAGSVIGLFYYLRIVVVMFSAEGAAEAPAVPPASAALLAVLTALLVGLGIYPGPVLGVIRAVAAGVL
ncbi:MAG: NADH-quinone oxidoreductase subunit N [Pseudomonadota bacterium]|nr:NADH-quinone oxidoreductase subunit N [Pseudomonadota bacterium]